MSYKSFGICSRISATSGSKPKQKCGLNEIPRNNIIFRRCKTRSRFCSTASTVTLDSRRDISRTSTLPRVSRRSEAIADLRNDFERKIRNREWKIDMLMKTDTLQDSLDKYRAKIAGSARNRAAAYELALASGSNHRPGDQISYYMKATPKKVPAYEAAKLASEFDPENRDENVDYYVIKLDDLVKKFSGLTNAAAPKQEDLGL